MASVQLRHIKLRFGDHIALDGLDLEVDSGDYVALLGENGCGKTTALRVIAGLLKPCSGAVLLAEKNVNGVPPRHRPVGMMMQGQALYPHLTAGQNIAFGLRTKAKTTNDSITDSINRAIEIANVGELMDRLPNQLSGGQIRRVAIAKSIAGAAPIRLYDEPLSAIDSTTSVQLEQELLQVHRAIGGTTIHVTHDPGEAIRVADKIAVMHSGRLLQYDSAENVFRQPNSVQVADRIAAIPMNWFHATVCENSLQFDRAEIEAKADWSSYLKRFPKLPSKILVGVRPESFRPLTGQQVEPHLAIRMADATRRNLGTSSTWVSNTEGRTFRATAVNTARNGSPNQLEAAQLETVQLEADAVDVMLFDAETGLAITPSVVQ